MHTDCLVTASANSAFNVPGLSLCSPFWCGLWCSHDLWCYAQGASRTWKYLHMSKTEMVCCSKAVFDSFSGSLTLKGYFPSSLSSPIPSSSLKMNPIIQLVIVLLINLSATSSCKIDQFADLALARIGFLLRPYLGYLRIALSHGLASDPKCRRSKF